MSDKTELLPCPFCGGTNIDPAEWSGNDGKSGPGCDDCGALAESVADWNRRATIQPTARPPVATVIKSGADRQWMSESLGNLPDGMYSLYLAPADAVRDARNEALYRLIERLDMVPYASTPHYELARELRALIATKEPAK